MLKKFDCMTCYGHENVKKWFEMTELSIIMFAMQK